MNHLKTGISYFAQGSYKSNKYNGKELQETGMYSYGWREYMPDIARWNGIDQLAESYYSHSPYAYVMNNPINLFDPNGMVSQAFIDELLDAPPGTTWTNTGNGFTNNWGGQMDYDGNPTNYNGYSNMANGVGKKNPNDGPSFEIPEVPLVGKKSTWADQFRSHMEKYAVNVSSNWYSLTGKGNWFFGTAGVMSGFAGVVDSDQMYSQGVRRGISGNYQLTGRNLSQFCKMAMTDATKPVSRIARTARFAGHFSFGIGVISDIGGMATGQVSLGKALINTGFGAVGNWGGSIGASLSTVYFGVDSFYPGAWPGLFDDGNFVQGRLDEGFNQAGPYRINVFGAH